MEYHMIFLNIFFPQIPYPHKGVVKFWINCFYVLQIQLFAQHPLVEGQGKATINELSMIECLKFHILHFKIIQNLLFQEIWIHGKINFV